MATQTAIASLTDAFDADFYPRGGPAEDGRPLAVIAWPSVPIEIVRAAGLRPFVMRGAATATPLADALLEADVFPSRLRQLVEAALAGRLSDTACVILPRTSDPDYKCFLYLREFVRRGIAPSLPPILLFDLLQSDGANVHEYNAGRTQALFETLATIAGRVPLTDALRAEVAHANGARDAVRRLLALRQGLPRVTGAGILPLAGAFWRLEPETYAALASEATEAISRRPPFRSGRVLLAGAPVDGPILHAAIESHGAIVAAEWSPWGSWTAGHDVVNIDDPIAAIADKYRRDAVTARTRRPPIDRWIDDSLAEVDAVVVSLPPDDAVFGWDYPALSRRLDARNVPHVCVRSDPSRPLASADQQRLAALMTRAAPRMEARHG